MHARLRTSLWLVAILVLAAALYATIRIKRELVDFEVYHRAGVRVLNAEPLYRAEDGHYQYKYFPAYAFAMVPFAWVDLETGKAIWYGLTLVLLVVFVRQSVRALPDPRLSVRALTWAAILLMGKYYVRELALGQTNVLLGVVLVGALVALRRGQRPLAGALVAVGIFIKPYALLLMPWLLVAGGFVATAAACVVLAVGLLFPAVVYGWQGNLDQLTGWYTTVTTTTAPNLLVAENISFATMWAKWIGVGETASTLALATGLACLALVGAVLAKRRGVHGAEYLEFGLLMLLVPLLSPQGWDYVLLLATPAMLCVVDRMRDTPLLWRVLTVAAIATMSFTIFDLIGRALYTSAMRLSVVSVAAVVMAVCLARLRWRSLA